MVKNTASGNFTVFRTVWMVCIWRRITPCTSTALPTNRLTEIDVLGDMVHLLLLEEWHAFSLQPCSRRAERARHDLLLQNNKHIDSPINILNLVNSTVFTVWMLSAWRRTTRGTSTALPTNRLAEIDVQSDLIDLLFLEWWHASPLQQ